MQSLEHFQSPPLREQLTGSVGEQSDLYERWLTFVGRHLFTHRLSSGKEPGFQIDACSRRAEGFTLARFTTVNGRLHLLRGPQQINADQRDQYVVYMPVRGKVELTQFDRTYLYEPFSAALLSSADPISHVYLGDNDTLCFMLPRGFVEQRIVRGEDICARPAGESSGARRLFADTLSTFYRHATNMTDAQFSATARIVGELALLAVSCSQPIGSSVRSVRTSNLERAKRIMRNRLNDPELTLTAIAHECGVSLRYLHDLFQEDGLTAREYLMSQRLQKARRMLESASESAATVTSISLACGFSNPSQFSTSFRRAFGLSPRDVLRRVRPEKSVCALTQASLQIPA